MNDDDDDMYKKTEAVVNDFISKGAPIQYFYTAPYKRGGNGWSVETYPYNVGIKHATGDLILLNSGDVISVSNTIDQHRRAHFNVIDNLVLISTVHSLTKETQTKIDSYDWKNNPSSLLFKGSCDKMYTGVGKSYSNSFEYEDAGSPYHFQMSVLKKHLFQIRGFDEDYYGQTNCGDDDFADRLKRCGMVFRYQNPNILALHQFHGCPAEITQKTAASPKMSGWELFHVYRNKMGVIRNAKHEWGQYPREMDKLVEISGVV